MHLLGLELYKQKDSTEIAWFFTTVTKSSMARVNRQKFTRQFMSQNEQMQNCTWFPTPSTILDFRNINPTLRGYSYYNGCPHTILRLTYPKLCAYNAMVHLNRMKSTMLGYNHQIETVCLQCYGSPE